VVKSYTTETVETDRVEETSRDYLDAQWDAITTRIRFWPTLRLVTAAGYTATFLVGGYWVMANNGPVAEPLPFFNGPGLTAVSWSRSWATPGGSSTRCASSARSSPTTSTPRPPASGSWACSARRARARPPSSNSWSVCTTSTGAPSGSTATGVISPRFQIRPMEIEAWRIFAAMTVLVVLYGVAVGVLGAPASVPGFLFAVVFGGLGMVLGRKLSDWLEKRDGE